MKFVLLILGLVAGLAIGWFMWHAEEAEDAGDEKAPTEQPTTKDDPVVKARGIWPDVPCPPGKQDGTARQKLNAIIDLATAANQWQVVAFAQACLYTHAGGPNHMPPPAAAMSQKVLAAHTAAVAGNWGACVSELDHPE